MDETTIAQKLSEMPHREKWWSELTSDEKIERMRQVLKNIQTDLQFFHGRVENLMRHDHSNQKIVVPLEERGYGAVNVGRSLQGEKPDDVWF